ncbi:MAG: hypothetical protein PHF86_03010 [Candidatus Nanoarchaeia archaeon]|nr:hypothetical protein [Candidatus Nanoarchaeia archaeon]
MTTNNVFLNELNFISKRLDAIKIEKDKIEKDSQKQDAYSFIIRLFESNVISIRNKLKEVKLKQNKKFVLISGNTINKV